MMMFGMSFSAAGKGRNDEGVDVSRGRHDIGSGKWKLAVHLIPMCAGFDSYSPALVSRLEYQSFS